MLHPNSNFLALLMRPIIYPYEAILIVSLFYRAYSFWNVKKKTKMVAYFVLIAIMAGVFKHLISWIAELELEAFYEIFSPDLIQASFYFDNLALFIVNVFSMKKTTALFLFYGVIALALKYCTETLLEKYHIRILNKMTIRFFQLFFILSLLWGPLTTLNETRNTEQKLKGIILDQAPINLYLKNHTVKTLLYIGESTSSMHMSLYGYPRSTNPRLQKILESKENLLVFDNVFSTHSYTTWSLMEALTFSLDVPNIDELTEDKKVIFFGNLFKPSVSISVASTQSASGSWSLGQKVLFEGIHINQENQDLKVGNHWMNSARDDRWLLARIKQWTQEESSNILIAHSLTGHGPYDLYTSPDHRKNKIDSFYQNVENPQAIFGRNYSSLTADKAIKNLEDYDSAVLNIDSNIADSIVSIRSNSAPSVLLYFSDHGESVFTQSGHDSSRFQLEMITVPLIIYMNKAFCEQYPSIQNELVKLKDLSLHTPLTLRIIPHLLALIYGGHIPHKYRYKEQEKGHSIPVMTNILDLGHRDETANLSSSILSTNSQIEILKAKLTQPVSNIKIGYHRANSVASAIRGSRVANFLECDVVIGTNDLLVYHPPADDTGLKLSTITQIAHAYKRGLWLDLKNLDDEHKFELLDNYLKNDKNIDHSSLLLELPTNSIDVLLSSDRVRRILRDWGKQGIRISYYMPSDDLEKNMREKSPASFLRLVELVNQINSLGELSDISFDYRYEAIIKSLPIHSKLGWNTWSVEAANIKLLDKNKYRNVIAITQDWNVN